MSWFSNNKKPSWFRQLCTSILKAGPIPKHVAFIMDGNRRFAAKNSMDRGEGHLQGFNKLAETLEWCRDLGITEVTVYAFSIENFKRSKEEVDCLMELARQKFNRLLEEKEMLQTHGVRVRIIGELLLLPNDIQNLIYKIMDLTKDNDKATLNVCFAYTSRHEICDAMKLCVEGVQKGLINESDITEELLEYCLYTRSSHPDLLVRTSGEVRLSDFLLVQSSYSALSFVRVLWPEFSIWHMYAAILHYQRHCDKIHKHRQTRDAERQKKSHLSDIAQLSIDKPEDGNINADDVLKYSETKQQRLHNFTRFISEKQLLLLSKLHNA